MVRTTGSPYRLSVATTFRMPKLSTRREFFRFPYPVTTGAVLAVDGASYKVGEISEGGLRVVSGVGRFAVDSTIRGTLTLTMGISRPVKGKVLRIGEDHFVLKLEAGPTCYDVMREQRHVAKSFPDWKPLPA
jgi:hypothetical protein